MSDKTSSDGLVVRLEDYRARKRGTLTDMEQAVERAKKQAAERVGTRAEDSDRRRL